HGRARAGVPAGAAPAAHRRIRRCRGAGRVDVSDAVLPDNRPPENPSPENRPPRTGRVRRGVHLLGGAALLAGVIGVLVHYLGPESNKLIILASFVPLLVLAAVAGTVSLAVIRAWR